MLDSSSRQPFPLGGRSWSELQATMAEYSAGDIDWRSGRAPMFVFGNDTETAEIGRRAFFEYFTENGLGGTRAFHGIGRMEREVLDFGLNLLNAPESAKGVFTPGGSESIFIAVKAAREAFRARSGLRKTGLNIVMPDTAHAAFDKAAQAMDLDIRRAPLKEDLRVDVARMAALVDAQTILLVGSAPCYPHGVIDDIAEIASLAISRDVWCHVDACVGGWILPFFAMNGKEINPFDFSIPGVRSISADLHKFGFCPKPASTVFFRDIVDQERSLFVADQWPSGIFRTATIAGTRPAGAVAAAWAVLNHLGVAGYRKSAERLARMTDAYVRDIEAIPGMKMIARPDLSLINFGSDVHDMQAIAATMMEKNWLVALTRRPVGLHIMMSLLHEGVRNEYIADLRASISETAQDGRKPDLDTSGYGN